ncbi:hypothetical protein GMRT_13786 [Giardia muris]|uniref:BRO1 domain-containing protein n=1 Tax=Giardia muris TaxID=5742 RepID=A0A4Z1T437_GIAMU|nr:hypothetical protein GMRT_13786 [Giardia muris]|eukprot:TNJ28743.1 hypothetical protein GMRT_13786 [Giardia muris]
MQEPPSPIELLDDSLPLFRPVGADSYYAALARAVGTDFGDNSGFVKLVDTLSHTREKLVDDVPALDDPRYPERFIAVHVQAAELLVNLGWPANRFSKVVGRSQIAWTLIGERPEVRYTYQSPALDAFASLFNLGAYHFRLGMVEQKGSGEKPEDRVRCRIGNIFRAMYYFRRGVELHMQLFSEESKLDKLFSRTSFEILAEFCLATGCRLNMQLNVLRLPIAVTRGHESEYQLILQSGWEAAKRYREIAKSAAVKTLVLDVRFTPHWVVSYFYGLYLPIYLYLCVAVCNYGDRNHEAARVNIDEALRLHRAYLKQVTSGMGARGIGKLSVVHLRTVYVNFGKVVEDAARAIYMCAPDKPAIECLTLSGLPSQVLAALCRAYQSSQKGDMVGLDLPEIKLSEDAQARISANTLVIEKAGDVAQRFAEKLAQDAQALADKYRAGVAAADEVADSMVDYIATVLHGGIGASRKLLAIQNAVMSFASVGDIPELHAREGHATVGGLTSQLTKAIVDASKSGNASVVENIADEIVLTLTDIQTVRQEIEKQGADELAEVFNKLKNASQVAKTIQVYDQKYVDTYGEKKWNSKAFRESVAGHQDQVKQLLLRLEQLRGERKEVLESSVATMKLTTESVRAEIDKELASLQEFKNAMRGRKAVVNDLPEDPTLEDLLRAYIADTLTQDSIVYLQYCAVKAHLALTSELENLLPNVDWTLFCAEHKLASDEELLKLMEEKAAETLPDLRAQLVKKLEKLEMIAKKTMARVETIRSSIETVEVTTAGTFEGLVKILSEYKHSFTVIQEAFDKYQEAAKDLMLDTVAREEAIRECNLGYNAELTQKSQQVELGQPIRIETICG